MNRKIDFTKMSAQGNNYIYVDNRKKTYDNLDYNALSKAVSDVRFGIGSDGLVLINSDSEADCFMRIFNSDGSEAMMCGNALRSLAFLLAEESGKEFVSINTLSGIKKAQVDIENRVSIVDLGEAKLLTKYESELISGNVIDIGNQHLIINNAHAKLSRNNFLHLAEELQKDSAFPDGINVELIEVLSRRRIKAYVYERGSGLTYACGSGASALFWDSWNKGLIDKNAVIELDGGEVKVSLDNNNVILEGEVKVICTGTFKWS